MSPTVAGALKSKTMWAGAATVAVAAVQYATPFIPAPYVPLAMAVAGLLNMYLRTVTSQPLAAK